MCNAPRFPQACQRRLCLRKGVPVLLAMLLLPLSAAVRAEPVVEAQPQAQSAPRRVWLQTPAVEGRIRASQLGLVINENDAYSVAVGQYYIEKRGLKPSQVLRLRFPVRPTLSPSEFAPLRAAIGRAFGAQIQGLAMAWRMPWAVSCNSITSAVTFGYRPAQCVQTCAKGEASPLFNQATALPYAQFKLRPSMLLAASGEAQAFRLIDRGVASDAQLGRRFGLQTRAVFASTEDSIRSVRSALFPPAIELQSIGVELREEGPAESLRRRERGEHLILFETGAVSVAGLDSFEFAPGAVADHLTSAGGVLDGSGGQMPATAWIDAGATASYGTVSEPCNHLQKFPHPQLLLQYLLKGSSVMEAYWRSVAWPTQGVFIGEPLAAPFGRPEPQPERRP